MPSGRHLLTFRLGLALVCVLPGSLVLPATPAFADLRVCNETPNQVSIALGYRAERGWQSEGWWVAPPSQCATVYAGALNSRFFYIFAADDIGGGAWDGSVYMCTRDETFTIFGVGDCLARGYERTGFFEIDTQNRTDWMLQLTNRTGPDSGASDVAPDQIVELGPDDSAPIDNLDIPDGAPGDVPPDAAGDQEGVSSE